MDRNIVNLVSKINDRNLQKRRESGLTSYAILSVIAFIAFQLIELIPTIKIYEDFNSKLLLFALTISLFFSVFLLYYVYSSSKRYSLSPKLLSTHFEKESVFEMFCTTMNVFGPALLYAYLFVIRLPLWDWYIFLILIFYLLNSLLVFYLFLSHNSKKIKFTFKDTSIDRSDSDFIPIMIYLMAIVIGTSTVLYYNNQVFPFEQVPIIKVALYIGGLAALLSVLFELKKHDFKSKALEDLEAEIYTQDLDDKKILEILKEIYLGTDIDSWVNTRLEKIDNLVSQIEQKVNTLKSFIKETEKIDAVSYPREVSSRNEEAGKMKGYLYIEMNSKMEHFKTELKFVEKENMNDQFHIKVISYKSRITLIEDKLKKQIDSLKA